MSARIRSRFVATSGSAASVPISAADDARSVHLGAALRHVRVLPRDGPLALLRSPGQRGTRVVGVEHLEERARRAHAITREEDHLHDALLVVRDRDLTIVDRDRRPPALLAE